MKEETKKILEMIENGIITAEEGLALIDKLMEREAKGKKEEEKEQEKKEDSNNGGANREEADREEQSGEEQRRKEEQSEQYAAFKEDLKEATEKMVNTANKGMSKLIDMAGKLVHKVSELDFDFDLSFAGGVKVADTYEVDGNRKDISFLTVNGSIKCYTWQEDRIQYKVTGYVNKVKEEEAIHKLREAILIEDNGVDSYSFTLKEKKGVRASLEIFLPESLYQAILLRSTNGAIHMENVEAKNIKVITTNGSIRLEETGSDHFTIRTTNGRILAQAMDASQIDCQTSNGSIQLEGVIQDLKCETTNGSIRLVKEDVGASDWKVKTSNGSVKIFYPDDIEGVVGKIETSFGSINCNLDNIRILEEFDQPHKKKIIFEQEGEKEHNLQIESSTGSVHVFTSTNQL